MEPSAVEREALPFFIRIGNPVIFSELKEPLGHRGIPWRGVADFLEPLEAERSAPGLCRKILDGIGALVPFDFGACIIVNRQETTARSISGGERLSALNAPSWATRDYVAHFQKIDLALPALPLLNRIDIDWSGEKRNGEYTADFIDRLGVRRNLVVCHVPLSGEDGFVLTLFRVGFGGIRPRESLILDALYPHLRNLFSARISPAETLSRRIWQVARDGALTPREEEILFCLCRRLSAREIADRLHMSRRTAEKHLENLYAKLRVTSRGEVRAQLLGERENS